MDIRVAGEERGRTVVHSARAWVARSHRRLATTAVCLLAVWLAFHVVSGTNGWMAYHNKKVEYRQMEREVEDLQKQNEQLDRRVKALTNDPQAIEKEAREQLGYVRQGEMVYHLPEQKPVAQQKAPQTGVAQQNGRP
jgi:cell division protein FtsB